MTGRGRTARLVTGLFCLGLAAAVTSGCGRQTPAAQPHMEAASHPVQGCWALELSVDGTRLDSVRVWLPPGSLPTVLRLDSARLERPTEGQQIYRARSYFGGRLEEGPFSAWRRLSGDSVLVDRPGALAGFALRLAPDDDGLAGILSTFTDVVRPGQPSRRTTPVRATPASCPTDGSTAGSSSNP